MVVADTDAEALQLARRAYPMWHASFTHLFRRLWPHADASAPAEFDAIAADGRGYRRLAARPSPRSSASRWRTPARTISSAQFAFGDLTLAETRRSIELFAREVMPALRNAN